LATAADEEHILCLLSQNGAISFCVERAKRFVNVHLHCFVSNLKSMISTLPHGKISADGHGKGLEAISTKVCHSLLYVRYIAERSFSKLSLIKNVSQISYD